MTTAQDISKEIIAWYSEAQRDLVPIEVWATINRRSSSTIRSWISKKVITKASTALKTLTVIGGLAVLLWMNGLSQTPLPLMTPPQR